MIRTILVDDEPRGLFALQQMLSTYCPAIKVVAQCSHADQAKQMIELHEPQLVFLDISLPGKNSFDMLEEMESVNFEIIFVTAHDDYVLKAFHYSAIDFLVKPIDEDLLMDAVRRAQKRIERDAMSQNIGTLLFNLNKKNGSQPMKLCIPSLKGFQVVELQDILYCEASGSYTTFYFQQQPSICSARPIFEYENLLADSGFFRVHKSFLVNLQHIREYQRGEGGTVVLTNNKEIEVSRRKKDAFISCIREFHKF